MAWEEIALQIVGAAQRFAVPVSGNIVAGLQNPEALVEYLLDADQDNKTAFQSAIRGFGKVGTWPEFNDLQKLLLYIRCRNALWFLNQLSTQLSDFPMTNVFAVAQPPPETPREVMVVWFLDSLWQNYRIIWMPEAVRELLGGQRM